MTDTLIVAPVYDADGEAGLEPRSRRPHGSPGRTPIEIEDEIVSVRKELLDLGMDAGAHTIAVHLGKRHGEAAVLVALQNEGFPDVSAS